MFIKIFSALPKNITEKQLYNLEKFCHILGLFETPSTYQTIKGNNYYYDFATCAYNFFHNNFLKNGKFKILDYLDGLNYRDFNSKLAKSAMCNNSFSDTDIFPPIFLFYLIYTTSCFKYIFYILACILCNFI